MSYPTFDDLTAEYPKEREAIERLGAFLATRKSFEVTLDRLVDVTQPHSVETLALILARLIQQHALRKFVRVESPYGKGGIDDYPSLAEVPDRLLDWRSGHEIDVRPENLRVMFAPPRD